MSQQTNDALLNLERLLHSFNKQQEEHFHQSGSQIQSMLNNWDRSFQKFNYNSTNKTLDFKQEEIDLQVIVEDYETTAAYQQYLDEKLEKEKQHYLKEVSKLKSQLSIPLNQEDENDVHKDKPKGQTQVQKQTSILIDQEHRIQNKNDETQKDKPNHHQPDEDQQVQNEPENRKLQSDTDLNSKDKVDKKRDDKDQSDEPDNQKSKQEVNSKTDKSLPNAQKIESQQNIQQRTYRDPKFILKCSLFMIELLKGNFTDLLTLNYIQMKNKGVLAFQITQESDLIGEYELTYATLLQSLLKESKANFILTDLSKKQMISNISLRIDMVDYNLEILTRGIEFLTDVPSKTETKIEKEHQIVNPIISNIELQFFGGFEYLHNRRFHLQFTYEQKVGNTSSKLFGLDNYVEELEVDNKSQRHINHESIQNQPPKNDDVVNKNVEDHNPPVIHSKEEKRQSNNDQPIIKQQENSNPKDHSQQFNETSDDVVRVENKQARSVVTFRWIQPLNFFPGTSQDKIQNNVYEMQNIELESQKLSQHSSQDTLKAQQKQVPSKPNDSQVKNVEEANSKDLESFEDREHQEQIVRVDQTSQPELSNKIHQAQMLTVTLIVEAQLEVLLYKVALNSMTRAVDQSIQIKGSELTFRETADENLHEVGSKAESKVQGKAEGKAESKAESKAKSQAEDKVENEAESKADSKAENKAESNAVSKAFAVNELELIPLRILFDIQT